MTITQPHYYYAAALHASTGDRGQCELGIGGAGLALFGGNIRPETEPRRSAKQEQIGSPTPDPRSAIIALAKRHRFARAQPLSNKLSHIFEMGMARTRKMFLELLRWKDVFIRLQNVFLRHA
jgi:hypothetical protein